VPYVDVIISLFKLFGKLTKAIHNAKNSTNVLSHTPLLFMDVQKGYTCKGRCLAIVAEGVKDGGGKYLLE
jgi:hypothetical protein